MKASHRYLKIVEWSEEDKCYVGSCPGLMLGGVHGKNEMKVYQKLCQVVEEWIKNLQKEGESLPPATAKQHYSGKFMLRTDKELHQSLHVAALRHGKSLNAYCVSTLKEKVLA